jgi:hypothetical protein
MGVVTCSSNFKGSLEKIPKFTVFKVINTGKTYLGNLDLGVAPKKVVWYYKIRQVGKTGDECRIINLPGDAVLRTTMEVCAL